MLSIGTMMPNKASRTEKITRNFERIDTGMTKKISSVSGRSGYSVAKAATRPKAPADAPTTAPAPKCPGQRNAAST